MDRYLMAQSKTETKSPKGQQIATWTDSFNFFAKQSDEAVSESFSTLLTIAPVTTTFSTHFRADLNRTMRIVQGADIWNIINISYDRLFMKIECQRMDD